MNRTYFRVAGVVALGLIVLVTMLLVKNPFRRKMVVRVYFANAMSLRAGAPVRLAGGDIGSVESVRARPELKEAPAEVVLLLTPAYELNIPSDSTVSLETEGVLGRRMFRLTWHTLQEHRSVLTPSSKPSLHRS